jgi:hypothetical protein
MHVLSWAWCSLASGGLRTSDSTGSLLTRSACSTQQADVPVTGGMQANWAAWEPISVHRCKHGHDRQLARRRSVVLGEGRSMRPGALGMAELGGRRRWSMESQQVEL